MPVRRLGVHVQGNPEKPNSHLCGEVSVPGHQFAEVQVAALAAQLGALSIKAGAVEEEM
jgi:hypothetical protein